MDLVLVGLLGGLITGISPCILPVLPIVFTVVTSQGRKPVPVVAGIVLSFSVITLLGTSLLSALDLPHSTIRWVGIGMLVILGLSMMIPPLGDAIAKPFLAIPKPTFLQNKTKNKGGLAVGLALGAVYAPCAGPVLAAVTVAGATGEVGWPTVILTLSFAVGAAIPLLFFAMAGDKAGDKVSAVQRRTKGFSVVSGLITIALAVALAFDAPAALQRTLPDWSQGLQAKFNNDERVRDTVDSVRAAGGAGSTGGNLENCRASGNKGLQECGEAPELEGLTGWFNTDKPVDLKQSGTVKFVDFWAYACINCQRANKHVTALYDHYREAGLTVVGVHAPEYSFERDLENVKAAAREQGIHYPVAQDNDFKTWRNYHNQYWPAHYLVDGKGHVRSIHEGEGQYAETEHMVRELLKEANPDVKLPEPLNNEEVATVQDRNPETYLGYERAEYFANSKQEYRKGTRTFTAVPNLEFPNYALEGEWTIGPDFIRAGKTAKLRLNYRAGLVQIVASGGEGAGQAGQSSGATGGKSGRVGITVDGVQHNLPVTPGTIDIAGKPGGEKREGVLEIDVAPGVVLHSMTFG